MKVVEAGVFVDRAGVETLQPAQTTAGGEEMEVGIEGDKEAGGQIRTVGVSLSSVHGLGEIPVRIISTLCKALWSHHHTPRFLRIRGGGTGDFIERSNIKEDYARKINRAYRKHRTTFLFLVFAVLNNPAGFITLINGHPDGDGLHRPHLSCVLWRLWRLQNCPLDKIDFGGFIPPKLSTWTMVNPV